MRRQSEGEAYGSSSSDYPPSATTAVKAPHFKLPVILPPFAGVGSLEHEVRAETGPRSAANESTGTAPTWYRAALSRFWPRSSAKSEN